METKTEKHGIRKRVNSWIRKNGNRLSLGLAGLALSLAAGCAAKPQDSVFLEETMALKGDNQTFYHFAALGSYAKVLVTDAEDRDTVSFATRGNINLGGLKGNAELIGFSDSDENYGVGVNARGSIAGTKIGIALERRVDNQESTDMALAYASRKAGNFDFTVGVSDVEDTTNGITAVSYTSGQNMFGAAVTADGHGEGFVTATAGRFAKERGKGIGYRTNMRSDFHGNYTVEALASTNTTLSKGSVGCPITSDNGFHDPNLFRNRFDIISYLWERAAPGGVIGRAKYSDNEDTTTTSTDVIYHFPERKGISPRLGVGYTRTNDSVDVTESVSGMVGTSLPNGGYFYITATGQEGEKPEFGAVVGFGF